MFLRANTYDHSEIVYIKIDEILCVWQESRFAEMSVHTRGGETFVIRAEPGWIDSALNAQSVYKRIEDQDLCYYGIDMQKVAIDPKDLTQEERLQRIDNVLEDFDFEFYPQDNFTANLNHLRNRFKKYIKETNNV